MVRVARPGAAFDDTAEDRVSWSSGAPMNPPSQPEVVPAAPPSSSRTLLHPRGRLPPPLAADAPLHRKLVRSCFRLGKGLALHGVLEVAPAMAFHFFLSLMPLLVFLGYVVGIFAKRRGAEAALAPFFENLPPSTEVILKKEVERMAGATTLGPLAAVGFIWIASGGAHGLMIAIERVVGAPRRAWYKTRLWAMAWVVGSLVVLTAASVGVVQWDAVVHTPAPLVTPSRSEVERPRPTDERPARAHSPRRRAMPILRTTGERAFALALAMSAAVGALAGFYRFAVTHSRRVRRRVFPGALLAVGVWLVVSWGFGLYVRSLAEYAVFYGSLAAVAVLLVWLWLTSFAMLVGAELNAQLEGLRD